MGRLWHWPQSRPTPAVFKSSWPRMNDAPIITTLFHTLVVEGLHVVFSLCKLWAVVLAFSLDVFFRCQIEPVSWTNMIDRLTLIVFQFADNLFQWMLTSIGALVDWQDRVEIYDNSRQQLWTRNVHAPACWQARELRLLVRIHSPYFILTFICL